MFEVGGFEVRIGGQKYGRFKGALAGYKGDRGRGQHVVDESAQKCDQKEAYKQVSDDLQPEWCGAVKAPCGADTAATNSIKSGTRTQFWIDRTISLAPVGGLREPDPGTVGIDAGCGGARAPAAPAGGRFAAKCRDAQTFGVLADGRIGRNQCQRLAPELGLTLQ